MNAQLEAVSLEVKSPAPRGVAAAIVGQFGNPHGLLGRLAGHVMALNNHKRSTWVLSLLALAETDRVLEVGFGPGVALQRASARVIRGKLLGIDHSATMLAQARRRNRVAIAAGRMIAYW